MKMGAASVESLIPYAPDARTHSDAQVAQIAGSIREFGFTRHADRRVVELKTAMTGCGKTKDAKGKRAGAAS
jgi:hypothetical protein